MNDQRAELRTLAVNQLHSDVRVKESPSDWVQKTLLEGLQPFDAFQGESVEDFAHNMQAILRNNVAINVQDARRRFVGTAQRSLARERPRGDVES